MSWSFKSFDELPEEQFAQWAKLLEQRTGITFNIQQKTLLQTQMSIRMRELNLDGYQNYFEYVTEGSEGIGEWQVLVDRLVVKETMFFRHMASLDFVRQLLHDRIGQKQLDRSFEVWSVGCSTGEESYSLAMVVNDCFELASRRPYFGITASDVSRPSLVTARKGIYTERRLTFVPEASREHYFEPVDKYHFKVSDKIKQRVCFIQANILDLSTMPAHNMDIIFCQNVLIYFRKWRRKEILNCLVSRLRPGGVLIIGLGEVTDWRHPGLERIVNEEIQAYVKCV